MNILTFCHMVMGASLTGVVWSMGAHSLGGILASIIFFLLAWFIADA